MTNGQRQIQVLSDLVANKIAAGEVVERPASVMKELVENAVDAGARRIAVDMTAGGKKLVAVSDDGCGMGRDDALLCLERHATSKIREVGDIERIATLGFRGEALAAISAVSQFTLITRRADADAGTEVLVQGGKIADVRDAGCPVGTRIEVRNLFFNVPARRKFLRSEAAETAALRQMFMVFSLSRPETAFRLTIDGRVVHDLAGDATLEQRIGELYGRDYLRALKPLQSVRAGLSITGYAGRPDVTRADRNEQLVFINGRAAGAPLISFAVQEAYRDLVPRGRFPSLFLFIEADPAQVDVNVHPTKKEVRFRTPMDVRDPLIAAIRKALAPEGAARVPVAEPASAPLPFSLPPRQQRFPYPRAPAGPLVAGSPAAARPAETTPMPSSTVESSKNPWADGRILGVVGDLYVVMETADGLVLLDQQAAHERVLYERLVNGAEKNAVESQTLLTPETVDVRPDDARKVRDHMDALMRMGFGIAEFGGDSFVVDRWPACLPAGGMAALLTELAGEIEEGGSLHTVEERIARAASHAAVRAGDRLSERELDQLVRDLARTEMPYTCPHGRPTVVLIGFSELARKFGRA